MGLRVRWFRGAPHNPELYSDELLTTRPELNALVAIRNLAWLYQLSGGDLALTLSRYHRGPAFDGIDGYAARVAAHVSRWYGGNS